MAIRIWLENIGYPNLVSRVMGQPGAIFNDLADEAELYLQCLEVDGPFIPIGGGLPLTKMLVQKNISLRIFNLKRYTAIAGIKGVLNNIYARICNEVLQIYLKRKNIISLRGTASVANYALNMPLVLRGFPHPLFGTFDLSPRIEPISLSDQSIWRQRTPFDDAIGDDRSMFLTFARGARVLEMEVMHLFTSPYLDCVKWLTMGENPKPTNLPFFTIVILESMTSVDQILAEKQITKLYVNAKPVRARKF